MRWMSWQVVQPDAKSSDSRSVSTFAEPTRDDSVYVHPPNLRTSGAVAGIDSITLAGWALGAQITIR